MFINASLDSRSLDMVDLRYVFNLLSALNERSHSTDVIGNVPQKMQIKVWMLGKNSRSHAARVSELHWWEGRHLQCCTTFSSIAGAQHQPHEEKEDRSHKTPALLQCQDFCLRRLPAQEED